ncbi:hypothetical protein [Brevibacterium aurantiacum]|nr:hypothetical protein [Brevibacterium aurantiacum]
MFLRGEHCARSCAENTCAENNGPGTNAEAIDYTELTSLSAQAP